MKILIPTALGLTLLSSVLSAADKDSRPNIVFLLADDLRYDSLGFLKKFELQTPQLDSLAKQGVRFTRSYNTTAICMASRAQIMTGRYEFSTGTNFSHGNMSHDIWQQSYPVQLKKNGYFTGFAGKFGFHVNAADGGKGKSEVVKPAFDWWSGWMGQGSYDISENKEADAWIKEHGSKKEHTTYALGQLGQDFIKKGVESGKPFCLSISFKAPHTPYATDPRYDAIYKDKTFTKPENYGVENAEHIPSNAKASRPFASKGRTWLKGYDKAMSQYHTMVYGMDVAIGLILDQLKTSGVDDNTIVIFTSDNGHFNGSKAMGGKILAYEEGSLAPTIIYDPRTKSSETFRTNDALTGNIDFANTILDYAGLPASKGTQGKSMLTLLKDKAATIHDSLMLINVWGAPASQSLSVVTAKHKYIHWFYGAGDYTRTEELYDMRKDRIEQNNLAKNPEHKAQLEAMQKLYDSYLGRWKSEGVANNGYSKYVRLGDRNLPFDQNSPEDIKNMADPKDLKEAKDGKKDNKKKAKKNKAENA